MYIQTARQIDNSGLCLDLICTERSSCGPLPASGGPCLLWAAFCGQRAPGRRLGLRRNGIGNYRLRPPGCLGPAKANCCVGIDFGIYFSIVVSDLATLLYL